MTYYDCWDDETTSETEGLKCPYCGYVDTDVWEHFEMNERGEEVQCMSCEKPFWASREATLTYYGAPAAEDQEKPK